MPSGVSHRVPKDALGEPHRACYAPPVETRTPIVRYAPLGSATVRTEPPAAVLETLLNQLHQRRRLTVICGVALMALGAWSATRLSLNDSPERWMPKSAIEAWNRFAEHFEWGDTIVVAVHFHDRVSDEDAEYLKRLRKDLAQIPGVMRVTDVSLVAHDLEGVPLTKLIASPPIPPLAKGGRGGVAEDPYALYRGVLFDDPRVWRTGSDPFAAHARPDLNTVRPQRGLTPSRAPASNADLESRTLLTVVELDATLDPSLDKSAAQAQLDERRRTAMAAIYQILEQHERPDVTFHAAGAVVIQHELEQIAWKLFATLVPLSLGLTILALGVGFRSAAAVAIAVLGGAWAIVVMLGGIAALGWTLNVVTVGGPPLMTVIIIAVTVHFAHYSSERESYADHDAAEATDPPHPPPHQGGAREGGRRHFVRWVAVPCLGAAMTTGFGFLMLAFNELGPARELGFELFAGAILAFAGGYLVWLVVHPFRAARGRIWSAERLAHMERKIVARPAATVTLLVAILAVLAWTSSWVVVDADPFSFFQPESRVAKALKHVSSRKFGHYLLDVILVPQVQPDDPHERRRTREADLETALAFESAIAQRPEVRRVVSTANMRLRMQDFDNDRRAEWARISPAKLFTTAARLYAEPGASDKIEVLKRSAAETAGAAWNGLESYLRYAAFRTAFKNWTVDLSRRGAMRVTFMVYDPGTGFRPLMEAVRDELEQLPPGRFDYFYTGTAANVAVLSEQLVGGMTRGLLAATAAMALLCVVLFRSLRITLIAVLPNAFPVLIVFGVMGLFGIPLNSGSAMVTTIALGVGLNDTVHFVMHYRRRRSEGDSCDLAVHETVAEIGRPIILTSVVNCLGFSIFLLSDFLPMSHFGLLAAIAMAAALVGDLVLLPNLLKLFDRDAVPAEKLEPVRAVG
ncbi:MAG: MMPL family transporter [Planctomycetes bacterium]|nr:MMPL family transporter [Planctomycetota bacterium]